jgi:hypothetical protein
MVSAVYCTTVTAPSTSYNESTTTTKSHGTQQSHHSANDVISSPVQLDEETQKKYRNIKKWSQEEFTSQSHSFTVTIPGDHKVVKDSYCTGLIKDREALQRLKKSIKGKNSESVHWKVLVYTSRH